jgi:hypothetical protein
MRALAVMMLLGDVAAATPARPGVVAALGSAERTQLAADVARARRESPAAFVRVRALSGVRREVYGKTRARRPEVVRELRALGADGLMPMLEVLALDGWRDALGDEERRALESGMLRAVGLLGDRRAAPVLRAAVEQAAEEGVATEAAIALGRLCSPDEVAFLGARAQAAASSSQSVQSPSAQSQSQSSLADAARRRAAIAGLGACRSLASAQRLATLVDDAAVAPDAAAALTAVGSSWAWQAAGDIETGRQIRALAAPVVTRAQAAHKLTDAQAAAVLRSFER